MNIMDKKINDVAVLFARCDSVYKSLEGVDVWDAERDARKWKGGAGVVAHPPCRAWGRLRHFAKPRVDEKELAVWAVHQVRMNGGVLEHPAQSSLWQFMELPLPNATSEKDIFGGWTLPISQNWWGHKAEKNTWLYIVGINKCDLPDMPMVLGESSHTVSSSGRRIDGSRSKRRPEITKAEREETPPALARWLVEVARLSSRVDSIGVN